MKGLNGPNLLQNAQRKVLHSLSLPVPSKHYLFSDATSDYVPRRQPTNEYTMATLFSPQRCYGVRDDIIVDQSACSRKRLAQYERRHSLTTTREKETQDELMNYTLYRANSVQLIVNRIEGHPLMVPAIPKPVTRKIPASAPSPSVNLPLKRIDRINYYKQTISQLPPLQLPKYPPTKSATPKLYETCDSLGNATMINLSLTTDK